MHFYSQSYPEVMALPLKTFWLMSGNVDRVMAQSDMRALTVSVCGQAGEAAKEYRARLVIEIGTIVKVEQTETSKPLPYDATRDEAGFAELRMLSKQQ